MKILFAISILSFLVLALAVFLVTRHVRAHAAEVLEPAELLPAPKGKRAAKTRRRSGRRKAIRAAA